MPSLGGVIYGRGWRQRKSLTEGKGTGDLHLREKGEKLPSLSSVRGQPANPWVSPLAAAGLRDGLRREASLPCPPGPRRERRMSEDGIVRGVVGSRPGLCPAPPGIEELGRRH